MYVNEDLEEETIEELSIAAFDGKHVTVTVVEFDGQLAATKLDAAEARMAAVRLMQAADLADPERSERYGDRWY